MKKTIVNLFLEGQFKEIVDMTLYECGCDKVELPLADYYEPIDGSIEEYLEDIYEDKTEDDYDIETTSTSLILITRTGKCTDCALGKTYVKDRPRPTGDFDSIDKYHGILAYMRSDMLAAKNHLHKVLTDSNYETCTSTEALGNVGAVLQGTVLCASNMDLYSKTDDNGRFIYMHEVEEYIIYDAQDMSFGTDGFNDELITRDNTLVNIWYKEHATNEEKEFAKELADYYNVPLVEEPSTEEDIRLMELEENKDYEDWMF